MAQTPGGDQWVQTGTGRRLEVRLAGAYVSPDLITPSCAPLSVYVRGVPLQTSPSCLTGNFCHHDFSQHSVFICQLCIFLSCLFLFFLELYFPALSLHLIFYPSHTCTLTHSLLSQPSSSPPFCHFLVNSLCLHPRILMHSILQIFFLSLGQSAPAAQPRHFLSSQETEDCELFHCLSVLTPFSSLSPSI